MIKRINFSNEPLGLYTEKQIKKAWFNPEIITLSVGPEIIRDSKKNVLCIPLKKGK